MRTDFEQRFGAAFGGVRVHEGHNAAARATALGAQAYTIGSDIVLGAAVPALETAGGRRVLAHELAHVAAPPAGGAVVSRLADDDAHDDAVCTGEPSSCELEVDTSDGGEELVSRPGEPIPAPEPVGPTVEFEGIVLAPDPVYLRWRLREYVAEHGTEAATDLVERFVIEHLGPTDRVVLRRPLTSVDDLAGRSLAQMGKDIQEVASWAGLVAPPERRTETTVESAIAPLLDVALDQVLGESTAFVDRYYREAKATLLFLLQQSLMRTEGERIRYGLPATPFSPGNVLDMDALIGWMANPYAALASAPPAVPALGEVKDAAGLLLSLRRAHHAANNERYRELATVTTNIAACEQSSSCSINEEAMTLFDREKALRAQIASADQLFNFQKQEMARRYPALAAYADNEGALAELATGTPAAAMKRLYAKITEIELNIRKVEGELADDDIDIWKLPRLIAATNLRLGVEADSFESRVVREKIEAEADDDFWESIGLGILQLGLVLLAPATGGLSLLGNVAISGAMLVSDLEAYQRESALAATDFDKANAIAEGEPSLFWVAMDIVFLVADVGAAAAIFRAVKPAMAEVRAARTVEETESALARLHAVASAEGGEELAERLVAGARAGDQSMSQQIFGAEGRVLDTAQAAAGREITDGVLHQGVTVTGAEVKVTRGGHVVICNSPCTWLRERFAPHAAADPALAKRLDEIDDVARRAAAEADPTVRGQLARQAVDEARALWKDLLRAEPDARIRPPTGKVNVGGAGEAPGFTNLNPKAAAPGAAERDWIPASLDEVAEVFEKESVKELAGIRVSFADFDWTRSAKGAYEVLEPGGTVWLNVATVSAEEAETVAKAFRDAGFERVAVTGSGANTVVESSKLAGGGRHIAPLPRSRIMSPEGKEVEIVTRGNAIVPTGKVEIYPRGRVIPFSDEMRDELRGLKHQRQNQRKKFDEDPANAERIEALERLQHNAERSAEMARTLERAGLPDVEDVNRDIFDRLLEAGQTVTADNRKNFVLDLIGPDGRVRILSTWKILPDGRAYLSTVILIPKP